MLYNNAASFHSSKLFDKTNSSLYDVSHRYKIGELKMSVQQCIVVGISGATCSGKSTLADKLHKNFPTSIMLRQDDYFLPLDDSRHIKIQELNHMNWELITSLDMQKMYSDVTKILQSGKNTANSKLLLILDGFLLFKHKTITDLCNLKYFLTLTKEQCWERRKNRVYDPPDVPGYFDKVVWPEFMKYKNAIVGNNDLYKTITFIDGSKDIEEIYKIIFNEVSQLVS